jgi:hypothetical protein
MCTLVDVYQHFSHTFTYLPGYQGSHPRRYAERKMPFTILTLMANNFTAALEEVQGIRQESAEIKYLDSEVE